MDVQPLPTTLRKRKCRANETSEQLENRRARDRENKRLKRSAETAEQHEVRLRKNRDYIFVRLRPKSSVKLTDRKTIMVRKFYVRLRSKSYENEILRKISTEIT